jgi:cbb3-type cytochrome oxidase maturation protein
MDALILLIPLSLLLGGIALAAFLWTMKSGQYDDLDGAAHRILFDDDPKHPTRRPADRETTP